MSLSALRNSSVNKRLLLDSHVFLWAIAEPENLTAEIRALLESPATRLYLSAATVWELLIKARKKKIDLGGDPVSRLREYADRLRALPLAITNQHVAQAFTLGGLHKDPFDRLLIAQARLEHIPLVTRDETIRNYDVETIW